ncbi:MAG: MATE family efflux transporter [Gammaproteobacteria bacterium]
MESDATESKAEDQSTKITKFILPISHLSFSENNSVVINLQSKPDTPRKHLLFSSINDEGGSSSDELFSSNNSESPRSDESPRSMDGAIGSINSNNSSRNTSLRNYDSELNPIVVISSNNSSRNASLRSFNGESGVGSSASSNNTSKTTTPRTSLGFDEYTDNDVVDGLVDDTSREEQSGAEATQLTKVSESIIELYSINGQTSVSNTTTPLINPERESVPSLTFWQQFLVLFRKCMDIFIFAVMMGLTYDISFGVVFLSFILPVLNPGETGEAASTVITTAVNTLTLGSQTPLFAASFSLNQLMGKFEQLKENPNTDSLQLIAKKKEIAAVYAATLLIAPILTVPTMMLFTFSKNILIGLGQNPDVAAKAQSYLAIYACGLPAVAAEMASSQVMFMLRRNKAAMGIALSSFIFSCILASLLGFYVLGTPGVAIGLVIGTLITAILQTWYIGRADFFDDIHLFHFFTNLKGNTKQLRDMMKLGSSIAFSMMPELALPLVTSLIAGLISEEAQAAWVFVMQMFFINVMLSACFGQSVSQTLSKARGREDYQEARTAALCGLFTLIISTSVIPMFFVMFPLVIVNLLDNLSASEMYTMQWLVRISAFFSMLDSTRNGLVQLSRALDDANMAGVISFLCLTTAMAIGSVAGLQFGLIAMALVITVFEAMAVALIFPRFLKRIDPIRMANDVEKRTQTETKTQISVKEWNCFGIFGFDESSRRGRFCIPAPADLPSLP